MSLCQAVTEDLDPLKPLFEPLLGDPRIFISYCGTGERLAYRATSLEEEKGSSYVLIKTSNELLF